MAQLLIWSLSTFVSVVSVVSVVTDATFIPRSLHRYQANCLSAGSNLFALLDGPLSRLNSLPPGIEPYGKGPTFDIDIKPRRSHDAGHRSRALRRSTVVGLLDGQCIRVASFSQIGSPHLRLFLGWTRFIGRGCPDCLPQRQRLPDCRATPVDATDVVTSFYGTNRKYYQFYPNKKFILLVFGYVSQVAEGQPEQPEEEAATAQVLSVLSSTMGLLRRCRVNAALTIQLFSQLFHALNAALFNRLVGLDSPRLPASASHHLLPPAGANLCSRQWGLALSRRLRRLEAWAERQGLELAADCHLGNSILLTVKSTLFDQ